MQWTLTSLLETFDLADDIYTLYIIVLMTFNTISYQPKATAEPKGLDINAQKTKSIRINSKQTDSIKISNTEVKDIKNLTYCLTT